MPLRIARAAIVLCTVLVATSFAHAQDFPVQKITLVSPVPPGGVLDSTARLIADLLERRWRQQVIVEPRPGAGTLIATEYVVRAKPDGYTLLYGGAGTTLPLFVKGVTFDPMKDLSPIGRIIGSSYILVTTPSVGAKTFAEFIAKVKAQPGRLNYAGVPFSGQQLDQLIFLRDAGLSMTYVPYNGSAPIITALLADTVQMYFGATSLVPHFKTGKMIPLAVTGARRMAALPDTPTLKELGLNMEGGYWYGLSGPKGMPREVVSAVSSALAEIVARPEFEARVRDMGFETIKPSPEEMAAAMAREIKAFGEVARASNIQPQ